MKTLPSAIFGLMLFASTAFAGDSQWLLGDDGKYILTTYEHRDGGDNRATDVTLIYGTHVLRGQLKNVSSGRIILLEISSFGGGNEKVSFDGTIHVDEKTTLMGVITFQEAGGGKEEIKVNTSFNTKEMGGR